VLVLFSTVTPAAGALGSQPIADAEEQTVGDVSVWEKAGIPLRVSGEDAATTVVNPPLSVSIDDEGDTSVSKNVHVYDTGSDVTVEFDGRSGIDPSVYQGGAQLIVARLDANVSALRDRAGSLNRSAARDRAGNFSLNDITGVSGLADMIREEVNDSEQVNGPDAKSDAQDNVSFVGVQNVSIDGNGEFIASFTPQEAGHYAVVAATGDGFSLVNGDDLALDGQTTIVGADTVSAQEKASDVGAPNRVSPGENITFDVETDIEDANHTVVLYDANTYEDQAFNLTLDDQLEDLDPDEITLEHTLKYVNGTTSLTSDLSFMGEPLTAERDVFGFEVEPNMNGSLELKPALERGLREAEDRTGTNFTEIEIESTDDVTLNVSAAAVTESQNPTINVSTNESWDGTFRWVHVATNNNGSAMETNSGDVQVSDDTSAPTLDITQPTEREFDAGTDVITFKAEYSDTETGIDEDSVEVEFNGTVQNPGTSFGIVSSVSIGPNSATLTTQGLANNSTYPFAVSVSNGAGLQATESIEVSINATEAEDGDDGDGGGGGGGGGVFLPPPSAGGDNGQGSGTPDRSRGATVKPTPDTQGAEVSVDASETGGQFNADFNNTPLGDDNDESGVALENISGSVSGAGNITVTKSNSPGEGVDPLSENANDVLTYITIEEDGETNTRDATFRFRVRADRLEQRGIAPENVALHRNDGNGWSPLQTSAPTPINNGQAYRYIARSPDGFSTFAVARRNIDTSGDTTTTTTEPTTTTTTTTSATVDTTTPSNATSGTEEGGGFGLAPLFIFLLLGGGGSGAYYAWRRGMLDDLLGGPEDESATDEPEPEVEEDVPLDEESDSEGVDLFDDEE